MIGDSFVGDQDHESSDHELGGDGSRELCTVACMEVIRRKEK